MDAGRALRELDPVTIPIAGAPGRVSALSETDERVWIDGSFLATRWTGVAYYGTHLLNALSALETEHDIAVLGAARTSPLSDFAAALTKRSEALHADGPAKAAGEPDLGVLLTRWPGLKTMVRRARSAALTAAWRRRRGLFHALNFVPPMRLNMPFIPVIHDMSCITHPETHPRERLRFFHQQLDRFGSAPVIQTVSRFSAHEIVRLLGTPASRIHVISPCPDPDALAIPLDESLADADRRLLRRHDLSADGYILGVGTMEPRKNLSVLTRAYLALPHSVQARFPLVLAGASGWGRLDWPAGHAGAVSAGRIRHLGYLSRPDILRLYRHARLSAYPSLYEGFGLPVLESMCLGTPVLVSAGTACEEAGGGHAIAVPAGDSPDAWAGALADALSGPISIDERRRLRAQAVNRPDWPSAARSVVGLYDAVAGGRA